MIELNGLPGNAEQAAAAFYDVTVAHGHDPASRSIGHVYGLASVLASIRANTTPNQVATAGQFAAWIQEGIDQAVNMIDSDPRLQTADWPRHRDSLRRVE